jgi:hypothetical protein
MTNTFKIVDIFNDIIKKEEISESWLKSVIILIHKKGCISDINNYRPITLTNHLYKLFMRMILQKSEKTLDKNLSENQAGLTNIITQVTNFKIDDIPIELVSKFKYLGQTFSFNNNSEEEVDNRISAAWKSFWSLKKFFQSKLPIYHKKRLFDTCILSTFTYGCQTWSLTNKQKGKLQIAQRSMERRMINVKLSDKISNEKLRKITKLIDVKEKTSELKWNWVGLFQRHKNEKRLPKVMGINRWQKKKRYTFKKMV